MTCFDNNLHWTDGCCVLAPSCQSRRQSKAQARAKDKGQAQQNNCFAQNCDIKIATILQQYSHNINAILLTPLPNHWHNIATIFSQHCHNILTILRQYRKNMATPLQQYFHIASQLRVCRIDCKLLILPYSWQLFEHLCDSILDGNDLLEMHTDCYTSWNSSVTRTIILYFEKNGLSSTQVLTWGHQHRQAFTVLWE